MVSHCIVTKADGEKCGRAGGMCCRYHMDASGGPKIPNAKNKTAQMAMENTTCDVCGKQGLVGLHLCKSCFKREAPAAAAATAATPPHPAKPAISKTTTSATTSKWTKSKTPMRRVEDASASSSDDDEIVRRTTETIRTKGAKESEGGRHSKARSGGRMVDVEQVIESITAALRNL